MTDKLTVFLLGAMLGMAIESAFNAVYVYYKRAPISIAGNTFIAIYYLVMFLAFAYMGGLL